MDILKIRTTCFNLDTLFCHNATLVHLSHVCIPKNRSHEPAGYVLHTSRRLVLVARTVKRAGFFSQ